MQIYRFSLIFHSISELNKEKQPDFAKIFAGDGRKNHKSRSKQRISVLTNFNSIKVRLELVEF